MVISERLRNTIVGLTMIGALVGLMIGIFMLRGLPTLSQVRTYTVTVSSPNAASLSGGNKVDFAGVVIGQVANVGIAPDHRGVLITLSIDYATDIPANALASINRPAAVGNPTLSLALPAKPGQPSALAAPEKPLPKDGSAQLTAVPPDTGLFPRSVIDQLTRVGDKLSIAGDKISLVSDDLHELLEKRPLADFDRQDPKTRVANVSVLVQRLDRVTASVDALVSNPDSQEKFRQILANLHASSEKLKGLLDNANTTVTKANSAVDEFAAAGKEIKSAATQVTGAFADSRREILKVADTLVTLLDSAEKTTQALAEGKGTAGKLLNDPRLYDGLLDLSRSLKATSDQLNELIRQWKQEGVNMHLK